MAQGGETLFQRGKIQFLNEMKEDDANDDDSKIIGGQISQGKGAGRKQNLTAFFKRDDCGGQQAACRDSLMASAETPGGECQVNEQGERPHQKKMTDFIAARIIIKTCQKMGHRAGISAKYNPTQENKPD